MAQPTVLYVTTNQGKYAQISAAAQAYGELPFVLDQAQLEIDELQSDDQGEIVRAKARTAWNKLQKPFLIEDSGIFFEKYHNFPGTFSKFIFKSLGFEGLAKLYQPGDRAAFKLVLAYCSGPDEIVLFESVSKGSLAYPRQTHNVHLPYQVMFIPDGGTLTYQERFERGDRGDYLLRPKAFITFAEWYKLYC